MAPIKAQTESIYTHRGSFPAGTRGLAGVDFLAGPDDSGGAE
jgi:hypothetical protein